MARSTFKKESSEATTSKANAESEERLIRKILSMLKNDVGEHKNHVARSCGEVMEDSTNSDGYYWVNVLGQSKKIYCARQEGRNIFSGSCSKAGTGNGWKNNCLNDVEFNFAKKFISVSSSSGDITIKKAGVYRITGSANMYSESRRNHFGRILINGKTQQFSYHNNPKGNSQEYLKLYYPLKAGNKVRIVWYINSGSKSKAFSASDNDGANRIQLDYIGSFEETALFSGGCKGHRTGTSWGSNCIDDLDWNPAPIQEKTFTVESNGDIIVKKEGYYHIQAVNMLHSSKGLTHMDIKIKGTRRQYLYTWDTSWRMLFGDLTYWVKAGEKISIRWKAEGSSPYGRHTKSGNNGYNRMQILYLGGKELKPYQWIGGCSRHSRKAGWATYCLNKSWRNDLKNQLNIKSNGEVIVKQSGFYRIAAHAIVRRKNMENAFSRILLDGNVIDSSTHLEKGGVWTEMYHDLTLPLVKGQKLKIQYMASDYAYHAWSTHSSVQFMLVDRK